MSVPSPCVFPALVVPGLLAAPYQLPIKIAGALRPLLREDPGTPPPTDLAGSRQHHSERLRTAGAEMFQHLAGDNPPQSE